MLLLSAVWWMRLSKRLVQASLCEGLVPVHWGVELGLVPLVGRAMSGGVFIDQLCAEEDLKQPVG